MSETMPRLTERALERRIKRYLRKVPQQFFAPCAPGFEDVLEREVAALPEVTLNGGERGGVTFGGPLDSLYHANLQLRTAHRVLLRVDDFLAQSYPALFDRVSRVPWELYLGFNPGYSLRVSAKTSRLRHHKNIAKAVADGIHKAALPLGLAPALQDDAPLKIHVRLFQDRCDLSLDTSGEHLHKRGYRTQVGAAPLRETLAASVLLASELGRYAHVLDPFCGSGTLLIEAALIAKNVPPGWQRSFAFEHMPSFQKSKWKRLKREALGRVQPGGKVFIGNDIERAVLETARANAAGAGVTGIDFRRGDALSLSLPERAGASLLVGNLPYGTRLGSEREAAELLAAFGKHLQTHYRGWDFAFVTHDPSWLAGSGLELRHERSFKNGGLAVYLCLDCARGFGRERGPDAEGAVRIRAHDRLDDPFFAPDALADRAELARLEPRAPKRWHARRAALGERAQVRLLGVLTHQRERMSRRPASRSIAASVLKNSSGASW